MESIKIKNLISSLGVLFMLMSIVMSGLMLSPSNASAFSWPWGNYHAHAQGGYNNYETVTVTIKKYIDGEPATSETAAGNSFAMTSSWDDPEDGAGSGSYSLSAGGNYMAVTSEMNEGADYSTSEVLDGDIVGATCEDGQDYKLVGYSKGSTEAAAASANVVGAASFTDLSHDKYVIVWNESCDDDNNNNATSSGSISGEVTGGQSEGDPGELMVTSIDAQKTTAIANGEFEDGWHYVFNITVPTNEPDLAMKFANWMQTDGDHIIPVANNMRISSDQAASTSTVLLTGADIYSSPELTMTGDLDTEVDGLQVQVLVEVAIPSDTYNGTYTTEYGVRTLP